MEQNLDALIIFLLDNKQYALAIEGVSEVLSLIAVETVPYMSPDWLGVANIRGIVTPVIDLQVRFGGQARVPALESPLIVLKDSDLQVALLVDRIVQISYYNQEAVVVEESIETVVYQGQLLTVLDWCSLLTAIHQEKQTQD